jgi:hypothetical protein
MILQVLTAVKTHHSILREKYDSYLILKTTLILLFSQLDVKLDSCRVLHMITMKRMLIAVLMQLKTNQENGEKHSVETPLSMLLCR